MLVAGQEGLDKQQSVLPVCHPDKKFMNSRPDSQYFSWELKDKSVQNFRTFTICASMRVVLGIGQEITIDYRITLADWLSIIQ